MSEGDRVGNTLAYLIGSLVIALGLLAFLFYDEPKREGLPQSCAAGHILIRTSAGPMCVMGYAPKRAELKST